MLPLSVRVDLEAMVMKSTPYSPKLQHYWSFTMRLFSAISRTLISGGVLISRDAVSVFYTPVDWARKSLQLAG